MTTLDQYDLIHQYADKRGFKVELHKTTTGWCVRLAAKDGKTQGEAKGRSPQVAYERLCERLHLGAAA